MQYEMSTKEVAWRLFALLVPAFVLGGAIAWAVTSGSNVHYSITWLYPDGTAAVFRATGSENLDDFVSSHLKLPPGAVSITRIIPPIQPPPTSLSR